MTMTEHQDPLSGTERHRAVRPSPATRRPGCWATTAPVGYHCTGCGWSGDDPDAQADRKHLGLDTAAAAIEPAARTVEGAMAALGHRGRQARTEGLAALRELHETLATVSQRLRRTQPAWTSAWQ